MLCAQEAKVGDRGQTVLLCSLPLQLSPGERDTGQEVRELLGHSGTGRHPMSSDLESLDGFTLSTCMVLGKRLLAEPRVSRGL